MTNLECSFCFFLDGLNFTCLRMYDCGLCWYEIFFDMKFLIPLFPWELCRHGSTAFWHGGSLYRKVWGPMRSPPPPPPHLPGLLILLECLWDCFCTRIHLDTGCDIGYSVSFFLKYGRILVFRFRSLYIKQVFFCYIMAYFLEHH